MYKYTHTHSHTHKKKKVEQVIKRLRLGSCADTPIKLISGGEKKRTNIGTEILTNPQILLLDEPTSGLDSTSAVALLKTLGDLAAEGRTILTSIHQPSSGVFAS
jgi:ABC-type multidrug transport system ATPase subunit